MSTLEAAALASTAWAACALGWSARRAWRRSQPTASAAPAGPAWAGLVYAFGAGMSPHAKESAREHPAIYAIGVIYHLGILVATVTLVAALVPIEVPGGFALGLALVSLAAAAAGLALVARRATHALLRAISAPDDYASNVLVDVWLVAAALHWLVPAATPAFLVASIALAWYAPLGKIRHCVFFFLSRGLYGARLGRRGIVRARVGGAAR